MNDIHLTGSFAYITILVWFLLAAIGVSSLVILAYWITDRAIRRTFIYFGIYVDVMTFVIKRHKERNKRK